MGVIELLNATVADQIAAGEVVNRPASVVKELLENAIDAGAKNISLRISGAGATLIQVVDDGVGMSSEDALLAFKRHATSKIRRADDLFSLVTFGFRGEALPSIASVAQVELRTRHVDDEIGTQITIAGGEVSSQSAVSCAVGSSFTIRNLFYNIPARREYLKTPDHERRLIFYELERVMMGNPHIGFVYQNENDTPLTLKPCLPRQRIAQMIKRTIDDSLIPVQATLGDVSVKGWISSPRKYQKTITNTSFFFVNGRYIRSAMLAKVLSNAYGRLIPQGQYPYFYLFFEIDPSQIDINIHPTKIEIRFANERTVKELVSSAVRSALGMASVAPTLDYNNPVSMDIPTYSSLGRDELVQPPTANVNNYNPFALENSFDSDFSGKHPSVETDEFTPLDQSAVFDAERVPFMENIPEGLLSSDGELQTTVKPQQDTQDFQEFPSSFSVSDNSFSLNQQDFVSEPSSFSQWQDSFAEFESQSSVKKPQDSTQEEPQSEQKPKEVQPEQLQLENASTQIQNSIDLEHTAYQTLQWNKRYIIVTLAEGLMVVDYPRALERISYERLLRTINLSMESQRFVVPHLLELSLSEADRVLALSEELNSLGFEIGGMGSGTLAVYSIPVVLVDKVSVEDVIALLLELSDTGEFAQNIREMIVRAMAGARSRERTVTLSGEQRENIVADLLACSQPNFTPIASLPIIFNIDGTQIKKKLKASSK